MNLAQAVTKATNLLIDDGTIRKATVFLNDRMVVKATRQRKMDRRDQSATFLLTLGRPNFVERRFIRLCKQAGEPFPVKKVRIQYWPKKKR